MTEIKEFTQQTIYYESYRKEYYYMGARKEGSYTSIEIICRAEEEELYDLSNSPDPRKQREIKARLKIHPGDSKSNYQEYIKVSRRGNNYNIIYSGQDYHGKYERPNKARWEILGRERYNELQDRATRLMVAQEEEERQEAEEEPLPRTPLAEPVDILEDIEILNLIDKKVNEKLKELPARMIKEGIEKGLKEAKEDYDMRIECNKYNLEEEKTKWLQDREGERLDTSNALHFAMMRNDRDKEMIEKLRKEVEINNILLEENLVKKALKRKGKKARRYEGVGLCYCCETCNYWHHYTDFRIKCKDC